MAAPVTPTPGQLTTDQLSALNEAKDRLRKGLLAFSGFMELVKGGDALNGEMLYWLLEPVESEICAGVECLDVLGAAA